MKIKNLASNFFSTLCLGLSILFCNGCLDEPHPSIAQQGHFDAIGVYLECADQKIKTQNVFKNNLQIQDTLHLTPSQKITCSVQFITDSLKIVAPPADPQKNLSLSSAPLLQTQVESWNFNIHATQSGVDSLRVILNHVSHADFRSPWIIVIIKTDSLK
jgi:hypothetical protein